MIGEILGAMDGVLSWTQDMEDCDQVLRIVSGFDLSNKVQEAFNNVGITSELMAVYLGNPEDSSMGVDYL